MATQTIHLKDDATRFRFKMGDKVVLRGSDGYADAEHPGVIVDGTWTGDPSGGSYAETYRIKRDKGGYVDAAEMQVLKRYDNEAELRDEVRAGLKSRYLPRGLPPAPEGELQGREVIREGGRGETCSACGHRIHPSDPKPIEYEYPPSGRVVRFHNRCNAIWLEEIRSH